MPSAEHESGTPPFPALNVAVFFGKHACDAGDLLALPQLILPHASSYNDPLLPDPFK